MHTRALLTGATGRIGGAVAAQLLERGDRLYFNPPYHPHALDSAVAFAVAARRSGVEAVVALAALGRRRTVVPGFRDKFLTTALATVPRAPRIRILGTIIGRWRTPTTQTTLQERHGTQ